MKTYFSYFILFILFHASNALCQQPTFSQYAFDPVYINPALTGYKQSLQLTAQYRDQWNGVENAPSTTLFILHAPIKLSQSSAGLKIISDKYGYTNSTSAALNYAYRIQSKIGNLSIGLSLELNNIKQSFTGSYTHDANDPLLMADENLFLFNTAMGIVYRNKNMYAGFSFPALIKNKSSSTNIGGTGETNETDILASYTYKISDKIKIIPSVLWRYFEKLPSQIDIHTNILWNSILQFDIGYRSQSAYTLGVEYTFFSKLKLGYSYDIHTSEIGVLSNGSHELMIGYMFKNKK